MTPINPTSMQDRTRRILGDLEAVRENLLALSDDIWLSIDHNDCEALEEGVQFKRTYNEKMAAFDQLASGLSAMIQQYTSVHLEAEEQSGQGDREQNERIVQELNREEPHIVLSRDDLDLLALEARVPQDRWDDITDALLWFCFLGVRREDGEVFAYHLGYSRDRMSALLRDLGTSEKRYVVHPAFRKALMISDKCS
jgi:hypothetical protein